MILIVAFLILCVAATHAAVCSSGTLTLTGAFTGSYEVDCDSAELSITLSGTAKWMAVGIHSGSSFPSNAGSNVMNGADVIQVRKDTSFEVRTLRTAAGSLGAADGSPRASIVSSSDESGKLTVTVKRSLASAGSGSHAIVKDAAYAMIFSAHTSSTNWDSKHDVRTKVGPVTLWTDPVTTTTAGPTTTNTATTTVNTATTTTVTYPPRIPDVERWAVEYISELDDECDTTNKMRAGVDVQAWRVGVCTPPLTETPYWTKYECDDTTTSVKIYRFSDGRCTTPYAGGTGDAEIGYLHCHNRTTPHKRFWACQDSPPTTDIPLTSFESIYLDEACTSSQLFGRLMSVGLADGTCQQTSATSSTRIYCTKPDTHDRIETVHYSASTTCEDDKAGDPYIQDACDGVSALEGHPLSEHSFLPACTSYTPVTTTTTAAAASPSSSGDTTSDAAHLVFTTATTLFLAAAAAAVFA